MLVIAEAGINHNGNLENAFTQIEQAQLAGADAVKFQIFDAERLFDPESPVIDDARRGQLDWAAYDKLATKAEQVGIPWLVSAFHTDAVDLMEQLGCFCYKVASRSVTDIALLKHIAATGKPVIMSTGDHAKRDVTKAVKVFENNNLTLLYCVPQYPTPICAVDFKRMHKLRKDYGRPVGFSDHTTGLLAGTMAMLAGAEVYEHHFTLSRKQPGCDQSCSWEPRELKTFMQMVRDYEEASSGA